MLERGSHLDDEGRLRGRPHGRGRLGAGIIKRYLNHRNNAMALEEDRRLFAS